MSKKNTNTNNAPAVTIADMAISTISNPTASASERLYAQYLLAVDSNPDKAPADLLAELNDDSKAVAVRSIVKAENGSAVIDWYAFMLGVTYPVLTGDDTDPVAYKALKVADFLALKANSRSKKFTIDPTLYTLLDLFGGNICTEYHKTRESSALVDLLYLSKYTTDLDGFKAENPASIGSMEKQLQTICNTLFTADHAPTIRKAHVRHLSDRFNKATRYNAEKGTGYTNGNAISLLQEIIEHAKNAHDGVKVYGVNGRLECQKSDK